MPEYICRKYPEQGENDWDEEGNYAGTVRMYDAETVIEAAMEFFHEQGEFPDQVVNREYDKVLDHLMRKPMNYEEMRRRVENAEKELGKYVVSRKRSIAAAQEIFHATKIAKLAINTSEGIIRR